MHTHPLAQPTPRRQIDAMEGETYTVLVIVTRTSTLFPGCVIHDMEIGRGAFTQRLVIHAQGEAPSVGSVVKRKRVPDGFAIIWADESGKVIGGGFTTAAVPRDWRSAPKPEVK